jgi:aconitate hydratase
VIAAITSCTNTSNPSVLMAAGCWQKSGRAWAKTSAVGQSLAGSGSKVVSDYLAKAKLTPYLDELGLTSWVRLYHLYR